MAKKVGFVDLSKNAKLVNSDHALADTSIIEVSSHLRKHGAVVDGHKKYMKIPRNIGIRLLGKVDFLKRNGFVVVGDVGA